MDCAIDFLKFICNWILENCTEDLKFVSKRVDNLVVDRLQLIATAPFEKISYSDAVEVLNKVNFLSEFLLSSYFIAKICNSDLLSGKIRKKNRMGCSPL